MSRVTQIKTRASSGSNARPAQSPGNLLQRQCGTCGTHTLAGATCPNCHRSKVQAKLKIGAVEDPFEHEADRAADAVTSGREAPSLSHTTATRDGSAAPDRVESISQFPGRPLEPIVRDSMERRFHYDFGHVRVHTDANAASAAESIGARAFTSGEHIAFGAGQYSPNGKGGLHLLAHELAHVVQQHGGAHGVVRRNPNTQKAPAAKSKFYQEVIDKLATATPDDRWYPILKALLGLCDAVEAGRAADVPGLLKAYLKLEKGEDIFAAPSSTLVLDLALKMMQLGLDAESQQLRDHIDKIDTAAYGLFGGTKARRLEYLQRAAAILTSGVKSSTPQEVSASIDQLLRVFGPITEALIAVHMKGHMPLSSMSSGLMLKPGIDPVKYEMELIDLTGKVFMRLQMLLQQQMDAAVAEVAAGKGTALLKTLDANLHKLAPMIHDGAGDTISDLPFDLTKTVMTSKSAGRLEDSQSTGRAATARSANITLFDPEHPPIQELQGDLGYLYEARRRQVDMIIRLYGATSLIDADAQKRGLNSQEATSNAAAVKATGQQFNLHSNDDWREFTLAKYKQLTGGPSTNALSKNAALQSVIQLLFDYLKVFTLHPVYSNIYDAGAEQDNYLTKSFPRSASGELLHDCGVYAVRVAYILSVLRKELGLRFHFVTLPQHIVLIIEGDAAPVYVVSNDQFFKAKASGPVGKQEMGELGASMYLHDPPDTPFRVTGISNVTDDKKKLWKQYQTTAAQPLFSNDAAGKKLELRYHEASDAQSGFEKGTLKQFWQLCPPTWQQFVTAIKQAARGGTLTASALLPIVKSYSSSFDGDATDFDRGLQNRAQEAKQTSDEIAKHPKRIASGAQLSKQAPIGSLGQIKLEEFRSRVSQFQLKLAAQPNGQWTLNAVRTELAPPFVTADDRPIPFNELKDTP